MWPHETNCESDGTTTSSDLSTESTNTNEEITTDSTTSTQNEETSSSNSDVTTTTTTERTTDEPVFQTPPSSPPINFFCPIDASRNFRHPHNCALFITCDHGIMYIRECPYNLELNIILYYNEDLDQCVWQNEIECITDELLTTTSSNEETTSSDDEATTASTVEVTTSSSLIASSTPGDTTSSVDFNTPPAAPPVDFVCPNGANRNFPHPNDCTKFIICANGIMFVMTCINDANGVVLHYNPDINACVHPWETNCTAF